MNIRTPRNSDKALLRRRDIFFPTFDFPAKTDKSVLVHEQYRQTSLSSVKINSMRTPKNNPIREREFWR